MDTTATLWPPKVFTLADGQLRVELLPAQLSSDNALALLPCLRVSVRDLPAERYRVRVAWAEETYAHPQIAQRRFQAFSGADAEYWMQTFYLLYMQPLTD